MPHAIIGRDEELSTLRAFLEASLDGSAVLAQQIFAGMVEVCEEEEGAYRPAEAAVERAVSGL